MMQKDDRRAARFRDQQRERWTPGLSFTETGEIEKPRRYRRRGLEFKILIRALQSTPLAFQRTPRGRARVIRLEKRAGVVNA